MKCNTFKLKRTVQCAKCPWKKSTDPFDIPHGYDIEKHRGLVSTIAEPGAVNTCGTPRIMACHHSLPGKEEYCIGWLWNQLGEGNNIQLRQNMWNCENVGEIRVVGEQHEEFKDTLPKTTKKQ